ncbi:unnamed protein product [Cyclocybe aegerita]|uniref:Uncharacterized protein n=1 Tax=Cyclocybe aegerita TaxID=1973307 RepID=A0A8S0X6J2_CYCAE|nr:unnamed protein product [Cyclocybe aegerita]
MDAQIRPSKRDCDWSFNFRSNYGSYDSDSDDCDEPPATQASKVPSEAKFLQEIDLSRREEAAVYKPNPFSIAKINAAYRKGAQYRPAAPRDLAGKATSRSPVPGSIMHGFKVQASRAPSVSKRDKAPERQPPAARLLQSHEPHELSSSCPQNDLLLSDPRMSSQKPENFQNSDAVGLYKISCDVLVDTSTSFATNGAHISTPSTAAVACLERRAEVDHRKEVPSTMSIPSDNPTARSIHKPRSAREPSPVPMKRSAIFTPRISRPDRPLFHSSPLKAPVLRNHHNTRPFTPSPPGHRLPNRSLARTPVPRLSQVVVPPKIPQQGSCILSSHASIKREEVSDTLPIHGATSALRPRKPLKKEESAYDFSAFAQFPPTASEEAKFQPSRSHQPTNVANKNLWAYQRESNGLNNGISSEGVTKRRVITAIPSRDAYSFAANDPDEVWSTLPSRKKKKPNEPVAFPTLTNSFRLPGLLAPSVSAGTESAVNKASGRRVTTYLPPPPPAALSATRPRKSDEPPIQEGDKWDIELPMTPPREAARRKIAPLSPVKDEGHVEMANLEAAAYPSPGSARRPISQKKEYGVEGATAALSVKLKERTYHPPSPPTSDPIIPPDEGDIRIQLDLRIVRDKYGQTKAQLQKVSSLFESCLCSFSSCSLLITIPSSADVRWLTSEPDLSSRAVASSIKMPAI